MKGNWAIKEDNRAEIDSGRIKKQKVVIMYVSAGAGHRAATAALRAAWQELYPQDEIITADILSFTPAPFRFVYSRGYLLLARKLPLLWRIAFYHGEDLHRYRPPGKIARFFHNLVMCSYIRRMKKERPDIIISTHFMPSDGTYLLKKKADFKFKFAIVVTDYGLHTAWLTPNADRIYVATPLIKAELLTCKKHLNIEADNIKILGIPIHPKYTNIADKESLRRKYNLDPGIFTILLFRDVFTNKNFEYFVDYLTMVPHPIQLIMLAGKDWPMPGRIKRKFVEHNIAYRIFGYIDFMEELMSLADIVMTKPGGLTTTECLAAKSPVAIYKPYAGQEERNAEFLMEKGAGIKINQLAGLPYHLTELIENRDKLKVLSDAAYSISKPNAAYDIVNDLKSLGGNFGIKGNQKADKRRPEKDKNPI